MKKRYVLMLLAFVVLASVGADECGPTPTTATYATQRKVPFFKILVYERLQDINGGATEVWLFEDEAGTCYITSGRDGGVVVIPAESCRQAKVPQLEPTK